MPQAGRWCADSDAMLPATKVTVARAYSPLMPGLVPNKLA